MGAAAIAGLVLGLLFGAAALLSGILACATRNEAESLPLHNAKPEAKSKNEQPKAEKPKDDKPKDDKPKESQPNQPKDKKDAKDAKDKDAKAEEWSGAKLWQEYVAKAGHDAGKPQYVVFDPKSGKIELKPAPANDAPFLKVHADGKVELVQPSQPAKGKEAQKGGDKADEKKQEANKDNKKDEKKDEKQDEKKNDNKKQDDKKADNKKADEKKQDDKKADDKKPDDKNKGKEAAKAGGSSGGAGVSPAANGAKKEAAASPTADCGKLTVQGTIELSQILQALGVGPSSSKREHCACPDCTRSNGMDPPRRHKCSHTYQCEDTQWDSSSDHFASFRPARHRRHYPSHR
ncbi:hypothetical protein PANT_20c00042 [Moesziomyces antarcticus T-34]|uniref:Uncharacterized protein n=1 Tax=Pseudozyma antarctica (strain T-34) TaxID=1151754 RepID=M9M6C4_PSEA3|nr:hypothetical protein PANT_20c00042 [Moesziomyces antarcticus T-34]